VQTLGLCPNQGWPRHRPDKLANTQQNPAFAQLSIDRGTQAGVVRRDGRPTFFSATQNVCFWHLADIALVPTNVCFWG
jgi:hypothetical protein